MEQQHESQLRVMIVDLERLVPGNHLLRHIKAKVDFTFIYDKVKHLYKQGGRPSVDPIMLVKMWLIGYLYRIDSERRLEQEISLNIAYRWFLGLQLDERVPDHSTLSANRNGRLRGSTVFVDIFEGIVDQCKQAGLVQSEAVVTDSTHIKANVSEHAYEIVTVSKAPREYLRSLEGEAQKLQAEQERKRGRKTVLTPSSGNPESQRNVVRSTTDPDAGILNRPGKPRGFHYLAHVTMDPTHGIIVDAEATPGNVNDHEPYVECIRRALKRVQIRKAAADTGYDRIEVHKGLADLGVESYTPPMGHASGHDYGIRYTVKDFVYHAETDSYKCPAGLDLPFTYVASAKKHKVYSARQTQCKACPLARKCLSPTARYRRINRPLHQEYLEQAHARIGTSQYQTLQRLRRVWCEGSFATLKAHHCLGRAMRRGLVNMQEQLLMAVTALNIKRLVSAMN